MEGTLEGRRAQFFCWLKCMRYPSFSILHVGFIPYAQPAYVSELLISVQH